MRWPHAFVAGGPWPLLVLPTLPLMSARSPVGWFPSTHNLSWDWYNRAQYPAVFLLGLLLGLLLACGDIDSSSRSADASLRHCLQRLRWPTLLLAWALILVFFQRYQDMPPPTALRWAQRALWGPAVVGHCSGLRLCAALAGP